MGQRWVSPLPPQRARMLSPAHKSHSRGYGSTLQPFSRTLLPRTAALGRGTDRVGLCRSGPAAPTPRWARARTGCSHSHPGARSGPSRGSPGAAPLLPHRPEAGRARAPRGAFPPPRAASRHGPASLPPSLSSSSSLPPLAACLPSLRPAGRTSARCGRAAAPRPRRRR